MAILRYVKTPDQVRKGQEQNPEFLDSTVRSIRCVYETHEEIARALLPRPLELTRPEIRVTFSHVAMHIAPGNTIEIGSAVFGVAAQYEGTEGDYLVTMPMTTEQAVVPGRELATLLLHAERQGARDAQDVQEEDPHPACVKLGVDAVQGHDHQAVGRHVEHDVEVGAEVGGAARRPGVHAVRSVREPPEPPEGDGEPGASGDDAAGGQRRQRQREDTDGVR